MNRAALLYETRSAIPITATIEIRDFPMFKRLAAAFALLFAVFSVASPAQARDNVFYGFMDWDAAAAQEAINNGERVVVNVWATWCPACNAQRRTLSALLNSDESFDDVKVFAVEFDDPNRPSAVGSHAITGSAARTTLVIFNQGQEVAVYGGQDPAAISSLLM